jgi:hypothetical protein
MPGFIDPDLKSFSYGLASGFQTPNIFYPTPGSMRSRNLNPQGCPSGCRWHTSRLLKPSTEAGDPAPVIGSRPAASALLPIRVLK